jgi:NADPH:quinone reductase-like Zn-dependent oxidoreductase
VKAIEIQGSFGLENLRLVDRPEPSVGPGQVKLRMRAASLNYRDFLTVTGMYNPKQPLPLIPCSDGVGEVVEVGEGVSRFQVGDRVAPIFAQRWLAGAPEVDRLRSTLGGPLDGTLAELLVVSEEGAVKLPAHLSDEEGACLPCAAVTAWSALVTDGGLRAGQTVLVLGTGGVSIFGLQIAHHHGARVIVTSSSDEKLARAQELGAWKGINYRENPDWGKEVRKLTGGRGVDHILEVGGAGTLSQSLGAVTMGGRIALIGVLAGVVSDIPVTRILMNKVTVAGVLVGHRESFEDMNRAFEVGEIRPVVDQVFPLAETRQALEHMAAGKHFGKIVIRLDA